MQVGLIVPQGWTGEYAGWQPQAAWARSMEIARRAEGLGFESLWLFDHMHTTPEPTDELTFESFTSLTAIAAATRRARLGHIVSCAGYRNAALQAKMLATMDTISGGRIDAGVGAGWKHEEWRAYGYDFPPTGERLDRLEEHLEILTRMLHEPGRSTWTGRTARVDGAINLPKPVGPMPIMVGGNGRERTWRLAARFADELNLDAMPAKELRADGLAVIRQRCEEIGRDPSTLRVSVHLWWEHLDAAPSRADALREYVELGVDRVMTLVRGAVSSVDEVDAFAADVRAAGASLLPQEGRAAA